MSSLARLGVILSTPVGEKFTPAFSILDRTGLQIEIKDVLVDTSSKLLVFSEPTCDPCVRLLDFILDVRRMESSANTFIYFLLNTDYTLAGVSNAWLEVGNVYAISHEELSKKINLTIYPTILLLDEDNSVVHIQYGFGGALDLEITEQIKGATRRQG